LRANGVPWSRTFCGSTIPRSALPVFPAPLRFRLKASPASLRAEMRGSLHLFPAGVAPLDFRQSLGSGRTEQGLKLLIRFEKARFLRGMGEEIADSPHFGIDVLKRLSCLSRRCLPLSRAILKSFAG
jgi:hypothetical protein